MLPPLSGAPQSRLDRLAEQLGVPKERIRTLAQAEDEHRRNQEASQLAAERSSLEAEGARAAELVERAVNGVWKTIECTVQGPPAMVGPAAMELGVVELAASQLRKLGTASDLLVRPDHSLCMF